MLGGLQPDPMPDTSKSTSEDIEYDPTVLKEMSTSELIYQMLCRKDLERPNRPHQLQAGKLYDEVIAKVQAIAEALRKEPLTEPFAAAVDAQLAVFIEAKEEVIG